jgi:hypothetical protein
MKKRIVATLVLSLGLAGNALAQTNLGEVLDKGARPLTKDAVQSLVNGAVYSGTFGNGIQFEMTLKTDGSISGSGRSGGESGAITGNWLVSDKGQLCTKLWNQGQSSDVCIYIYKVGDDTYTSQSDSNRGATAFKRGFKK